MAKPKTQQLSDSLGPSYDPVVSLGVPGCFLIDIPGFSSGAWFTSLMVGGSQIRVGGIWRQACSDISGNEWHYQEYVQDLEGVGTVERHILWLPTDRILLLADSVLLERDENIHYTITLPTDGPMMFEQDAEAREIYATERRRSVARVVPLSLPEWQNDVSHGEFILDTDGMTLIAKGHYRLFEAVLLDFAPVRLRRRTKMTWRRLTVGRQLAKVDDSVAVGFRYQAGSDQYLLYRSLDRPVPRSILGEHIADSFVFSRFTPDGAETILCVEPE